ncbi:hypothetical protein UFOVP1130_41 [uncultured Caudovirales phage]|uniref:Uncharacterized protein n=1 Tax=uncultured Caudovirales phage TaxID=2100421 RepID=A0A6J5QXF3_9CAUD|nr:hypothetical protein UFOVP1130_41 [uncultured Caudovirales phage]
MARGVDSGGDGARVVDMKAWKMRNHPASGGAGGKPPKKPRTRTGDDGHYESADGGMYYNTKNDDANPYGMQRPNSDWYKD